VDTVLAAQCANILEQAATEPGSDGSTRCRATQAFLSPPEVVGGAEAD
jgi:hypothetical protein